MPAEARRTPRQVRLTSDALEVVLLPELGARLHSLRAFGHDVLRAPADPAHHRDDPFMWGGYVMAPWCNRVQATPVEVAGRTIALGSNFPDGTAIHGQVALRPWLSAPPELSDDPRSAAGFTIHAGGDGWPWHYEVGFQAAADGPRLRVRIVLINRDRSPMPGGVGLHPWFIGSPEVAIRGATVFSPNTDTPVAPVPVAGPTDLRRLQPMPEGLDATWADLTSPPVELVWPALGLRAGMRVVATSIFIVAASPPGAGAIAVEPETHAPQGLRRLVLEEPGALALIEPGEALELSMELEFARG